MKRVRTERLARATEAARSRWGFAIQILLTREHCPPAQMPEAVGQPGSQGDARVRGAEVPRARAYLRPRGSGTQVQQTLRARIWGPRGPGAGRAHLRVVEQPQLVEPLRGGHGLTRLWPCCAPPVAASSAPPAGCPGPGPWAGGRHPGAERRYTAGGSLWLPTLSHLATKVYNAPPLPPPGRPPPGFLHWAVCGSGHRPASLRTVQRAGSQAGGGA